MNGSSDRVLTMVGVISTILLLSSLTYEFLLHEEEEVSFSIDDSSMMEDINRIASFGVGVAIVYAVSMYANKNEDLSSMSKERKLYKSGILTAIALAIHNFRKDWPWV